MKFINGTLFMQIRRIIALVILAIIFNTTLSFTSEGLRSIKIVANDGEVLEPFGQSWAVVVGIDDYQKVGKLKYAVNDAKAVKQMLQDKYGFAEDHIFTLYDNKATKSGILQMLGDELPYKIGDRDRLLVYFAGHGESSLDNGYLIPVDFRQGEYRSSAISMTELKDILKDIKAKHIYMVLDACYSGMFFTTRAAGVEKDHPRYLQEITRRKARQALTAGGKEPVSDGGYKNHSAFTGIFLEALGTGYADYNGDGIITASEINLYIQPKVAEIAEQTPEFGNLPGSEGGEFVFISPYDSIIRQVVSLQPVTQREEVLVPVEEPKEKQIKLATKNVLMEVKGEGSDILETLLSQKLTEAGWHIYSSNGEENSKPDLNLSIETSVEFLKDLMGIKSYMAKAVITLSKYPSKKKVVSLNKTENTFGLSQVQAVNGKREDQFSKKIAEPLTEEFLNKLTGYYKER